LWPDASIVSGKAAIAAIIKDMLQDQNLAYSTNFSEESMEIAKSGDLAYTRGFGTITMTDPKSRKALTAKGKYVMVFKKQTDGHWKGIIDTYNLDAAAK
jgi:ketosteroid isomerase-like protein